MLARIFLPCCFVVLALCCAEAQTDAPTAEAAKLTLDQIYASSKFNERSVNCKWLPKSEQRAASYLVLESVNQNAAKDKTRDDGDKPNDTGKSIVQYDAATGKRSLFLQSSDLIPPGQSTPLSIDDYQWSSDLGRVLIFTDSVKVWRQNTRGDYWVLDRGTGQLIKLGKDAKSSTLMYAKFAPDGNSVAYVRDGDLYVEDLLDRRVRRLTDRPNERILNGMSDWVYEEEFGLRDAFQWSPDGKQIAYWRFDTSGVQDFTLINNTDSIYPTTKVFAYPKAGTRNSDVRVAVVDLATGTSTLIEMPGDPRNHYIPRMQWIDQTGELLVRQMNRLQNRETLTLVSFDSATKRIIHTENDDAWIDLQDSIQFTADAESFLYLSDRDGWQHLYRKSVSDDRISLLTTGSYDVVELLKALPGTSDSDPRVYFIASPDSATERFLFSYDDGQVSRITPQGLPGVHRYEISPCGRFAIHRFSTAQRPTVTELVSLPDHTVLRVLESNETLVRELDKLEPIPTHFFQIDLGETVLDAWRMNPPGMEAGKKYPLLVYVYGEPAGSTVIDRWGSKNALWHRMMAQRGYIVMSIDNRGTKVPRGRDFRKSVYRRLGSLGPDDQAAALEQLLKDHKEIDADRVGIWGWSGGGTSTLHGVFRYPDLYRTGVAVAPVANLSYYDTIYEERYMALPASNVDGYRSGSAIHFVEGLKGDLLLVHGTADDNVHYQATELLINELIEKDKLFEMFLYPGRSHSINERKNTRKHVMSTVTRFLDRTLPTGGRSVQ